MSEMGGYPYEPDYVVVPGEILEEYLNSWGLSKAEVVRRSGLSLELIEGILAGESPIEPDTANEFEEIFGLNANVWLRMEAKYRDGLEQGKRVPDFKKETAI